MLPAVDSLVLFTSLDVRSIHNFIIYVSYTIYMKICSWNENQSTIGCCGGSFSTFDYLANKTKFISPCPAHLSFSFRAHTDTHIRWRLRIKVLYSHSFGSVVFPNCFIDDCSWRSTGSGVYVSCLRAKSLSASTHHTITKVILFIIDTFSRLRYVGDDMFIRAVTLFYCCCFVSRFLQI